MSKTVKLILQLVFAVGAAWLGNMVIEDEVKETLKLKD